jgi:hypothetical protein
MPLATAMKKSANLTSPTSTTGDRRPLGPRAAGKCERAATNAEPAPKAGLAPETEPEDIGADGDAARESMSLAHNKTNAGERPVAEPGMCSGHASARP